MMKYAILWMTTLLFLLAKHCEILRAKEIRSRRPGGRLLLKLLKKTEAIALETLVMVLQENWVWGGSRLRFHFHYDRETRVIHSHPRWILHFLHVYHLHLPNHFHHFRRRHSLLLIYSFDCNHSSNFHRRRHHRHPRTDSCYNRRKTSHHYFHLPHKAGEP